MTPDILNGLFELIGALLLCLSIRRLLHDREVKGVSAVPVSFFACWGFWNLYFYPSLDQWWSFYGGLLMVAVNSTWILLMLWFAYVAPWYEAARIVERGFREHEDAEAAEQEASLEARLDVKGIRVGDVFHPFAKSACPYPLVDERGDELHLTAAEWTLLQNNYTMIAAMIRRDGGVNRITDVLLDRLRKEAPNGTP